MVSALFDTNIVIDYLNGIAVSAEEYARYENVAISIVTWMEVLVGVVPESEKSTHIFLSTFAIIPLTEDVALKAIDLRRRHRIKLPDAIVWASAQVERRLFVTRNTKDYPSSAIRMPYRL